MVFRRLRKHTNSTENRVRQYILGIIFLAIAPLIIGAAGFLAAIVPDYKIGFSSNSLQISGVQTGGGSSSGGNITVVLTTVNDPYNTPITWYWRINGTTVTFTITTNTSVSLPPYAVFLVVQNKYGNNFYTSTIVYNGKAYTINNGQSLQQVLGSALSSTTTTTASAAPGSVSVRLIIMIIAVAISIATIFVGIHKLGLRI